MRHLILGARLRCPQISSKSRAVLIIAALLGFPVLPQVPTYTQGRKGGMQTIFYRTARVDGLSVFYREAGPKDAPTIPYCTAYHRHRECFSRC